MTNRLVRSDPFFRTRGTLCHCRFSAAFTFAVAFALAFAFAFALAYVIHFHWICFSEVVHDPCLVRVQVGLDDRSQFVVVTLKLLRVHSQIVSQFLWGLTQHHAYFHVIIQLSR